MVRSTTRSVKRARSKVDLRGRKTGRLRRKVSIVYIWALSACIPRYECLQRCIGPNSGGALRAREGRLGAFHAAGDWGRDKRDKETDNRDRRLEQMVRGENTEGAGSGDRDLSGNDDDEEREGGRR